MTRVPQLGDHHEPRIQLREHLEPPIAKAISWSLLMKWPCRRKLSGESWKIASELNENGFRVNWLFNLLPELPQFGPVPQRTLRLASEKQNDNTFSMI